MQDLNPSTTKCYKLSRNKSESAEEWIGHLRVKENECNYKKDDRWLKEQFIKGINDEMIAAEIIVS